MRIRCELLRSCALTMRLQSRSTVVGGQVESRIYGHMSTSAFGARIMGSAVLHTCPTPLIPRLGARTPLRSMSLQSRHRHVAGVVLLQPRRCVGSATRGDFAAASTAATEAVPGKVHLCTSDTCFHMMSVMPARNTLQEVMSI